MGGASGRQRGAAPAAPVAPVAAFPAAAMYQYPYQAAPVQPTVSGNQQTYCLFVYNLPPEEDDSLLYRLFGPFGAISHVKITRDPVTGTSKGYGFVHFMKYEEANQAVLGLNGAMLENKMLQVSFKAPKTNK
jgi:RNA recognition motif-containing protein